MTFSGQTTRSVEPGWIVRVACEVAGEHLVGIAGHDCMRALRTAALDDGDAQRAARVSSPLGATQAIGRATRAGGERDRRHAWCVAFDQDAQREADLEHHPGEQQRPADADDRQQRGRPPG